MRIITILVACIFINACETATSIDAGRDSSATLSEQEKSYLSQAEYDGRLMYEKDIRAANATGLLLAKINPGDYPNLVGWVTYPNSDDFTVSFYQRAGEEFEIIADVIYSASEPPVVDIAPSRKPTELEVSMVKARIAALQRGASPCTERHNTVVLPSQSDEYWDVYVLAATTDPTLVQVGGHVKVTVVRSDAKVIDVMPLSKSCLAIDITEGMPEGATLAALTVSHIVTEMPIAIHPYINLLHDIDLAVSTKRGLWMVSSGQIKQL
ncbi:hypothetical protein [Marinimicrobium sp. ABcell2]|uniref:hypothetical protein n=1 Tax=Marinimicrobium sp. ABcell2 TaxID=3069751 RepID=UPI0027B45164|nr:hypothetical protein [Marinimicrobium sp. ABcell2]MDQ2078477.1 hypothetical protein [Marinimicrobium sp. ABcell2]